MGKFIIKKTPTGAFNFSLIASNSKSKSGCLNGIKSVATNAINAEIVDETVNK